MFYEFYCKKCKISWEKQLLMKEEHIDICPNCKEKTHSCITGGVGFIFKGEGFPSHDLKKEREFNGDANEYYKEVDEILPGKKGTGN